MALKKFLALAIVAASATPSFAVGTVLGTAVSGPVLIATAVTGTVVTGVGAAVVVSSTGFWDQVAGYGLAVGGIVIIAVDPPAATYYDGAFSIRYPSHILTPLEWGWLGDWGSDPTDLAPPVHPEGGFPDGGAFVINTPNELLQTSSVVNPASGTLAISFDWGAAGHEVLDPGPFHFFAAMFRVDQAARIYYTGSSADPMAGANFYSVNNGIQCAIDGAPEISQCGSRQTDYFSIARVPEPASWAMLVAGFGLVGGAIRRRHLATA